MSARGRHRRQRARRVTRLSRISLMLTAGGAGVALPLMVAGGAQAAQADTYTVVAGDTLSRIAKAQDVDGGWRALYDANRDLVGDNPNLIRPGQELVLTTDGAADTAGSAAAPQDTAADSAAETSTGYTAPVAAAASTGYGVAGSLWSSGYHTGTDFSAASGTPVVSIAAGEVVKAGDGGAYGNEIVILHADGHYSQYAHLSSISVSVGQQVGSGDQIGLVGTTGNSTGPHLHFEVRTGPDYGSDIDPLAYLRANGVTI
ncbi:M23 family metallopeptidase [Streptomyces sp. 4N509B]|uniref:M23 family metallopeptidase n=1 Tax=Streptomyces sp. 4N509B TaxID=3457413 RepID=UPI003FD660BE